ncbi:MAG TPA: superoxide dismutase family protein [Burkholderiales bacterium]|jgi:Cu-Zn family superoxide dismutase|nr:superoxide dismutase family protein [Burkholderiales bacterium]
MKKTFIFAAAVAALAGCQSMTEEPARATAALQPTTGSKAFGEATFEQVGDKVHVIVFAQGLKPNQEHGFHIHEAGDCSSGDGMSAKGHFNPFGKPHGNPQSGERHAGDLPPLKAGKDGRAKLDVTVDGISIGQGAGNIVGRGLIVHADPDDYKTQPTGNAGARIACGVIKAG